MRSIPIFTLIFGALLFIGSSSVSVSAQNNRLITGNSAGGVRIGMTVAEARRAMPRFTFRRTSDGEGIALIEVRRGNQTHMTLYAGEFDSGRPIDNSAKIEFIEVWNRIYSTAAGVHPQMLVRNVERRYGKLSSIMTTEIEAREYGRFVNQPGNIDLRLQARNSTAGIYTQGQTTTTRYSPTAYVFSIIVIGGSDTPQDNTGNTENTGDNNNSNNGSNNTNFTSLYTDLRANCRTPRSQDGGHVSTYCQGQGDYQVHIFDTATTMEIRVESKDRSRSVAIASQSLSFNRNNQRIEWRMKEGKPFAVIMRGYKYRLDQDGLIRYPEQRTGEYLFVKGLPGYEQIDYEVNVRTTSNANERARQMADMGFDGVNTGQGNNSGNAFQIVNINRFNRIIDIANRNRENWVKSPSQTVYKLIGEIQDAKSRVIRFQRPSAEGGNSITAVITEDGLLDDSTRSQRLRLQLVRDSRGTWRVTSGQQSWRCQQGRGHQDFSAVPCN
ncbi:MAG: hypothetical protein HKN25_00945 [Pyrinomonadaceae bacterium]|nr:hypothetical protein [Pyrinomonadaceae bacterium]